MAETTEVKVLADVEEAPHLQLNQDGSSIDLSNWQEPANRNYGYRHVVEILPSTQKISRGECGVHSLNPNDVDISSVSVEYRQRDMQLEEFLFESHCDGFIVLKGDDIIYENHRRMTSEERHLCQSVSKTTICSVIGGLITEGVIDVEQTVDYYLPEVGSGFNGVKIQNLLDMNVGLKFTEDFTNPDSDIHDYEIVSLWRPERDNLGKNGQLSYICGIEHDPDLLLNDVTQYLCPNTDTLVCIIERTTGKPFTTVFEENIYSHIGAQADAYFSVDSQGTAIGSGGLIIGLRDLARYGQVFANYGVANDGAQVIPRYWLDDCLDTSKGTNYYVGNSYKYHNQMTSNGRAFCHLGIGGQMIYANPETKVVVIQFSTLTSLSCGDIDVANALYGIAERIDSFLS